MHRLGKRSYAGNHDPICLGGRFRVIADSHRSPAFLEGTLSVLHEWRRPAAGPADPAVGPAPAEPRRETDIVTWLVGRLARESGIHPDDIDLGQPFASFGVDSARALLLVGDLERWLGRPLPPIVLWNYPTVEALARHLAG